MPHGNRFLTSLFPAAALLLLASCGDMESPVPPLEDPSDPVVFIGTVLGVQSESGVTEPRVGAITGLAPVPGTVVELVRIDSDGAITESLDETVTDEDGVFTFEDPPEPIDSTLMVIIDRDSDDEMRALVSGQVVDINPLSEHVTRSVLSSDGELTHFLGEEVAALHALLVSMDIDLGEDETLTDALATIEEAGGTLFPRIVAAFSAEGMETVLHGSNFSLVDFMTEVRDPFMLVPEDEVGGITADATRGGTGNLVFGDASGITIDGRQLVGRYLHDLSVVRDRALEQGLEEPPAFDLPLGGVLHIASADRELIVANSANPRSTVAGPGAVARDGSLMVYPLDVQTSRQEDDTLAAHRLGLRLATRWAPDDDAQDLTLLDPDGDGTDYNFVRLTSRLIADPDSDTQSVHFVTTNGLLTFNSQNTIEIGDGSSPFEEMRDYGHSDFSADPMNARTLDLNTHEAGEDTPDHPGPTPEAWRYHVFPNTGQFQLRIDEEADDYPVLGHGVVTRDGEVLAFTVSDGEFDEEAIGVEGAQSLVVAVRQPNAQPEISGTYHLVEHVLYLDGDESTSSVESGYRYGVVTFDNNGGADVAADDESFGKRVGIDIATAQEAEGFSLFSQTDSASLESASLTDVGNPGEISLSLEWSIEGSPSVVTVNGRGAVSEDGAFIVIATEVVDHGVEGRGRGLLFLIRQPD